MLMKENGRNSCSCFANAWGEMYETILSIIGAHMKGGMDLSYTMPLAILMKRVESLTKK